MRNHYSNGSHFYNFFEMYKNTEDNILTPIDVVKVRKHFKATQTGCLNISSSHFNTWFIKLCRDKYTILNCNIIVNCESSGQYIKLSQGQNFL